MIDLEYLMKNLSILKKWTKLMNNFKISPSKASKYKINIAKDGVLRSANQF